jgi:hypothetical protein
MAINPLVPISASSIWADKEENQVPQGYENLFFSGKDANTIRDYVADVINSGTVPLYSAINVLMAELTGVRATYLQPSYGEIEIRDPDSPGGGGGDISILVTSGTWFDVEGTASLASESNDPYGNVIVNIESGTLTIGPNGAGTYQIQAIATAYASTTNVNFLGRVQINNGPDYKLRGGVFYMAQAPSPDQLVILGQEQLGVGDVLNFQGYADQDCTLTLQNISFAINRIGPLTE